MDMVLRKHVDSVKLTVLRKHGDVHVALQDWRSPRRESRT